MPNILALIVGGLAGWLIQQVPGLDPTQAHDVAQVLLNHWWSVILMVLVAGWRFMRRPGDLSKKTLEDYRELLKMGIDPAAPASAVPVKEVDPRG